MKTTKHSASWKLVAAIGVASTLMLTACSGTATSAKSSYKPGSSAAASAALPAQYKKAGVIRVASDIPFPPMEMFGTGQKLTGFDYDLGQALGKQLGVRLEFQTQSFDSIIPSLQSGRHDIIMSGMNDTKEREKTVDYVDYFHAGFSILVARGNPDKITTVLDLCGKNVAVQTATTQAQILQSYNSQCASHGGPIKISQLPLETDAQTAVRSGKAVADVVDSEVAAYSAQTAGGGTIFEVVRDPANPNGYEPVYTGIGVLKKDSALTKALRLALAGVIADGEYAQILKKYDLSDFGVTSARIDQGS